MNRSVRDYLQLLEQANLLAAPIPAALDLDTPITLVSYDSRNVIPGTLFICKGAHFKPEFLAMARDKGAVAYVKYSVKQMATKKTLLFFIFLKTL